MPLPSGGFEQQTSLLWADTGQGSEDGLGHSFQAVVLLFRRARVDNQIFHAELLAALPFLD